jgi:hypothetical protein
LTHVFLRTQSVVTLRHQLNLNREVNHRLHRLRKHATVDIINRYLGRVTFPVAAPSKA